MTTDRPYRKALSTEEALKEIHHCSGTQFDPGIAAIFIRMIRREKDQ
jgi:HD-GYP domain-containing protein (c-di-GMP phosphodiesterase class II)